MNNIIISGVDLGKYDIFDADNAEKYEKVLQEVNKQINTERLKTSDVIRMQCEKVFYAFNILFGEGTDEKIFGNKTNIRVCLEAFASLIQQINLQKEEVDKIASKYSSNRAQKRVKK